MNTDRAIADLLNENASLSEQVESLIGQRDVAYERIRALHEAEVFRTKALAAEHAGRPADRAMHTMAVGCLTCDLIRHNRGAGT